MGHHTLLDDEAVEEQEEAHKQESLHVTNAAHERAYALARTADAILRVEPTAHHHVGNDNRAEYGSHGAEDGNCGGVVQDHDEGEQKEPARQQHTAFVWTWRLASQLATQSCFADGAP